VPARLISIKYITIRAEKVASPVTALHIPLSTKSALLNFYFTRNFVPMVENRVN